MCQQELIKRDVEHAFGIDFDRYFAYELISLVDLENDGLVEIFPDRIVVTPRGKLLLRPVAMQFDVYARRTNLASGNGASTENRFSRLI
jgi:oxygen-independent coproporphyrinogen-3 oxidase